MYWLKGILIAMAMSGALAGCATSRRANDAGVPADFALGLTVPARKASAFVDESTRSAGALSRAAWYLVEADGDLRVGLGERTAMSVQPGRVRHLSAAERLELWRAVDGRFMDAGEPGNAEMPRGSDGPGTAVV